VLLGAEVARESHTSGTQHVANRGNDFPVVAGDFADRLNEGQQGHVLRFRGVVGGRNRRLCSTHSKHHSPVGGRYCRYCSIRAQFLIITQYIFKFSYLNQRVANP
jgi:hypothetical protein